MKLRAQARSLVRVSLLWAALASNNAVYAQAPAQAPVANGYSASLLYNEGNKFAQAGKPGMAVLSYERAKLLDPSDPDIDANLHHVRAAAGSPPEPMTWLDRAARVASPRTVAWAGLFGLLLAGCSLLGGRAYPKRRIFWRTGLVFGIAILGFTVCDGIALWPLAHQGVVTSRSAAVRVSPAAIGEPAFTLPEAEIVRVRGSHDDFLLVRTHAGRTGWVARADVTPVVPAASAVSKPP